MKVVQPVRCGLRAVVVALSLALAAGPSAGWADQPPASPPAPFQPGAITIGEPLALPSAAPKAGPADAAGPAASSAPVRIRSLLGESAPPSEAAPRTTSPRGRGWLGMAVGASTVPGRWTVDEVAAAGPAAAAGILAGDEVRAIDGQPLRNADEVSEALTAIAPGQRVNLAIARNDQVSDIVLLAAERPPANAVRGWQSAPELAAAVPLPADEPPAGVTVPSLAATPPFVPADPGAVSAAPRFAPPAQFPAQPAAEPTPPQEPPPTEIPTAPGPIPAPAMIVPPANAPQGRTALGVRTVSIDASLQSRFNLPEASGAYVIGVVQDLPASRAGVPPGSVIVALGDRPVRSPDELTRLVTAGPVGRPVPIHYVLPGGTPRRVEVVLQALERPLEEALAGPPLPTAVPVPILESGPSPTTARRPGGPRPAADVEALEAEVRDLRGRLERLEQQLRDRP